MLTLVSKFLIRIKYGDGLNAKGTLYDSWNHGYGFTQTMQKFFVTKKTAEIIATLPIVNFSDTLLP